MKLARSFFFLFLIPCSLVAGSATSALAGDDPSKQSPTLQPQNEVENDSVFGAAQNPSPSSGLFFLHGENPRLHLARPAIEPKSAVLDDDLCYTMRTYKVKRTERLSDNESGRRGYSTCELAKNYQVRSAIAHVRDAQESKDGATQK